MNGDYEEALRRALHAAADSIEPSADGLERIRERLNRPMLSFEAASAWSAGTAAWPRRRAPPLDGAGRGRLPGRRRPLSTRARPAGPRPAAVRLGPPAGGHG